jgi:histidine triad (HIT) family protein
VTASDLDFYCHEAINGHTAVEKLFESDDLLAFQHTKPKWETHIVVVPKRHVVSLADPSMNDTELNELISVVRRIASQVLADKGECRVVTNLGRYQDSKHLHFHVTAGERRP